MECQGSVYPVIDHRRRLLCLTLIIRYKTFTESAMTLKIVFSSARLRTEMLQAYFNQEDNFKILQITTLTWPYVNYSIYV